MLALSRSDLRRVVPMSDAVDLMKTAFIELSAGRAESPLRTSVEVGSTSAFLTMPGYVPSAHALGVKIVSFFPANSATGLPTIHALVYLVDDQTGEPLGVMDGAYVTALRTGAVSGAATDLLAREDASTLAVVGAGVQGVTQAAAVCAVRPIRRIIVADSRPDALPRYVEAIRRDWPELAGRVETTTDVGVAVREADVVCTATTATSPVFRDHDLRPGTHINAVGAFTPEMQEIPPETVVRAQIVVDNVGACLAEAGDLIKPMSDGLISVDHFSTELGMVAAGLKPGRGDAASITFFKSVGNAVQDVIVARRAVDQARVLGIGLELELTR